MGNRDQVVACSLRRRLTGGVAALLLAALTAVPVAADARPGANVRHQSQPSSPDWPGLPVVHLGARGPVVTSASFGGDIVGFDTPTGATTGRQVWSELPLGQVRLWDTEVDWADVEPRLDQYDFGLLDREVNDARAHHAQVLYVLGQTPTWASALIDTGASDTDPYGYHPDPPTFESSWDNYVRTVATRYRGRIGVYEVWNEVDLSPYWNGGNQRMIELAVDAENIIASVDPRAKVIGPSFSQLSLNSHHLANYLHAQDVVSGSLVSGTATFPAGIPVHEYTAAIANEINVNLRGYQVVLDAAGLARTPVYLDELGAGWRTPPGLGVSQPDDISAELIDALEAGVTAVDWYPVNHSTSLIPLLGSPHQRNALAFRRTRAWLLGDRPDGCADQRNLTECVFSAPQHRLRILLWAYRRATVRVPAGVVESTLLGGSRRLNRPTELVLGFTPVSFLVAD